MKQQTVTVKYDQTKYDALAHYLAKQDKSIEEELKKYLGDLYKDQVPEQVREYLQSQNPDETLEPEDKTEKPKLKSTRKKHDLGEDIEDGGGLKGPTLGM